MLSLSEKAPTNHKSENSFSDLDENRIPVYGFFDVPWKQLLQSAPFWSVLICNVTTNLSWFTMITCMPTYMSRVLGFSLEKFICSLDSRYSSPDLPLTYLPQDRQSRFSAHDALDILEITDHI
ncbi:hypothetical protein FBUS_02550 [Fasciolopsis buskii]|uniref:Uncharacterized protein n=1 Tax=Fasciolopsis buskii TaxID=27845 RepID=A0A8E0RZS7_9TREM|nr:hypothetical protein FBUS_02550 [Fasciolopsis buski]